MSQFSNIKVAPRYSMQGLRRGLTLVELVISILIAGMMMVSLFFIYSHSRGTIEDISRGLDQSQLPERILQLIAQDVDRFSADSDDLTILSEISRQSGLYSSKLTLQTQIYDGSMRPVPYEKVVWETRYDAETDSMILYRSHSGLVSEDNLLESQRTAEEASAFVPLCSGLTYFNIDRFPKSSIGLPNQLIVSLSFAQPEVEGGEKVIAPELIMTRTIAVNRLRKIGYIFTEPNLAEPDVNEPDAPSKVDSQTSNKKTAAEPNQRGRRE
jgi:hypothetical protein